MMACCGVLVRSSCHDVRPRGGGGVAVGMLKISSSDGRTLPCRRTDDKCTRQTNTRADV